LRQKAVKGKAAQDKIKRMEEAKARKAELARQKLDQAIAVGDGSFGLVTLNFLKKILTTYQVQRNSNSSPTITRMVERI